MSEGLPVLRSIDLERDAEKIAQMWNASDDQWPGSFIEGVPVTADYIKTQLGREEYLDYLIWDTGDRIAGSCSLRNSADESEVIYLPLLNVAPGFQGQSLGRRFLVHAVGKVVEWKKARLDLDTWSGNLKAVPLYKKCGFFWTPGPRVEMRNFMPAILQAPCAKPFFEKHDWYTTFQRELTQVPDDEQWEGLNVFTYRFVAEDESLTVRVDREARRITSVDTAAFFVSAVVDDKSPVRGCETRMHWRVVNRQDKPLSLSLIAQASGDLVVDYREEALIGPDETRVFETTVAISETAGAPEYENAAPTVTTRLRIGDVPVELGTGIRPRVPLTLSVDPNPVTLTPGVPLTVHVQLRSHLAADAEVTAQLTPAVGLVADWTQQTLMLLAGGHTGLPLTLTALHGGRFGLTLSARVQSDGKPVPPLTETQILLALPPGGLVYNRSGSEIRIENERFRAVVVSKGGELILTDLVSGDQLATQGGRPVPPLWTGEYRKGMFALELDTEDGSVVATATLTSKKTPGFIFRRTVRMNAGPIVTIEHTFENAGLEPLSFRLYQYVGNPWPAASTLTLALKEGLVRDRCVDFPGSYDPLFERSSVYEETWAAYEFPYGTVGVLWPDDGEEIHWQGSALNFTTPEVTVAPGKRVVFGAMRLSVGDGGWQSVQRVWRRLAGKPTPMNVARPEPSRELSIGVEPSPVVVCTAPVTATLRIKQFTVRPTAGTATLELPEGWKADRTNWAFSDVNYHTPFTSDIRFDTEAPVGAYSGRLILKGTDCDEERRTPLIRIGDGRPVAYRESATDGHRIVTISNGLIEIDVAPSFNGTVSAIRDQQGVNQLASAFPSPAAFNWLYPWYGGITPIIDGGRDLSPPGLIVNERFEVEKVSEPDARGIVWTGARQRAMLTHEELLGLTLELDTLTVGGSPVVRLVWRFRNETTSPRKVRAGWQVFVQPDGDRTRTILFCEDYERKNSSRTFATHCGHWAGAENPATGSVVALISSLPQVQMDNWGIAGGHLLLKPQQTIPANGTMELVAYVVIADSRDAVRAWSTLRHYDGRFYPPL